MSVIHMESFTAFGRGEQVDDGSAASVAMRQATMANLIRAGYDVVIGANNAAASYTGWAIRIDPVSPANNALTLSLANAVNVNAGAAIRRKLPMTNKPVVMGIGIYVPADYVAPTTGGVQASPLRFMGTLLSDATWSASVGAPGVGGEKELFRVRADLTFGNYLEAPISTKKLGIGRMNYVEVRLSDTETRVWLDDTLVFQKSGPRCLDTLGFVVDALAATGMNTALGTRWAFTNWYILTEDGVAPAQRLGPTTRVAGVRPTNDVKAQFIRPVGPTSNAAVVAQDLVDAPAMSLQSTTVGDEDIYRVTSDTAASGAAMIHAVAVKALAANLESAQHSMRPFIQSGGVEGADVRPYDVTVVPAVTDRALLAIARRPTDGRMYAVGANSTVLRTPPNGDGTVWEVVAGDSVAINNTCIAFREDGFGLIGRSNGTLISIDPATDALSAPYNPGSSASTQINTIVFHPSGSACMFAQSANLRVAATNPQTAASWVAKTSGLGTANLRAAVYNPVANVISCFGDSTGGTQSSDGGVTWAVFVGPSANIWSMAFYGGYTYAFYQMSNNAANPSIWRSADGKTSWQQVTSSGNAIAGAAATIQGVAVNSVTGEFTVANGLGWATSLDGVNYSRKPSVSTTNIVGVALTANGDAIMVAGAGFMGRVARQPVNAPLAPLAGYQMTMNVVAFDPATATNWLPNDAAAANFGMRLTS